MRLPTRSFLSTIALTGAVALVLAASLGGTSAYFGGALVLLVAAAAIGLLKVDRRVPDIADTEKFISSVLNARGYGGAYSLREVAQVTSAGIEPGHVLVKFRGEVYFHEALYQPSTPKPETFQGIPPRKIEWLRKMAGMLETELGEPAQGLAGRMPADPFRAVFVAMRQQEGWFFPFSGSAWAVYRNSTWTWEVRNLSQSIDSLVVHGKPLGAYPAAIAPASPEGSAWLRANLAAWKDYEREIATMQQKLDELRAQRGREAMGGFFHDVQAGATYHGTGESLSHQVTDAKYFLEFVSTNADNRSVVLTLRSDKRWQSPRRFSGSVAFDESAAAVSIHVQTTAADAQPGAGPLLSVEAGFELELRWRPGSPARLEGSAVDLVLRLQHVAAADLEKLLDEVHARKREIAAAIAPGRIYRGTINLEGTERSFKLEFLPSMGAGLGSARIESTGWSGMFRLVEPEISDEAEGMDVSLEPTARISAPVPGGAATSFESWDRVLLRLHSGRFSGLVIAGEHRLVISQLSAQPPSSS